ncbi:hypothetical protein FRC01_002679 [Tulasnella sp. 417]|nr:hypothetical protein FRC01_002679 [Tulasnella sp. 417]
MSDPDPSKERGNGQANANTNAHAHAHTAGGAAFNRSATEPVKEKNTGHAGGTTAGNRTASEPPTLPGLAELVEVLNAMAASPLGARPHINPEVIERIKNSPLSPVLKGLNPVYKKLGPLEGSPEHLQAQAQAEAAQRPEVHPTSQPSSAPGPGPSSPHPPHTQTPATPGPSPPAAQQPPPTTAAMDVAELKNMQAGLKLLSSTLDSVAEVVTDVNTREEITRYFQTLEKNLRQADSETRETVKTSATGAKTQIEAVDKKVGERWVAQVVEVTQRNYQVSQLSGKLDPLAELAQGVKRLQDGLLDEAKAERGRLEARNKELENQVKELQQIIHETRAELLPVEVASKIALHGTFSDEPDKKGSRGGTENAAGTVLQTAKKVRTNTLGLVAKCRVLFTFLNRGPTTDINAPDFGTEGEWSRCVEHLQESSSKLRNAVEEKEETVQKLLYVGFVIEQIRKGHYTEEEWEKDDDWKTFASLREKSPDGFASIRRLAQDLAQVTAEATPPAPNGPAPSTTLEGSQTPTAQPTNVTVAPAEPDSMPMFTAPSSPDTPTKPIPAKKDRDAKYVYAILRLSRESILLETH